MPELTDQQLRSMRRGTPERTEFFRQALENTFKAERLRRDIAIGMEEIKQGKVAPLNIGTIKSKGRKLLAQKR